MLSQTSVPKRNPSSSAFEQCSILRRLSSTCPIDGIVFCDAAPDTNPLRMQIEFFDAAGSVVRTVTNTGTSLAVTVFCNNGVWTVASATSSTTFIPISSVFLRRMPSTCPLDGLVFCDAAQETNVGELYTQKERPTG
ncbi:unnamed protein product [Strongylus vulgaris]|uniref:Uncharacterized protein n=1 Tax=Strongylus vulgaris TaxID=40348 RepID=A0A3P7LFT5_STRVU|nr:unnamed protein product [Strongylus vulgaris]